MDIDIACALLEIYPSSAYDKKIVKHAYKKRSRQTHPDKTGGQTIEEFQRIREAYKFLRKLKEEKTKWDIYKDEEMPVAFDSQPRNMKEFHKKFEQHRKDLHEYYKKKNHTDDLYSCADIDEKDERLDRSHTQFLASREGEDQRPRQVFAGQFDHNAFNNFFDKVKAATEDIDTQELSTHVSPQGIIAYSRNKCGGNFGKETLYADYNASNNMYKLPDDGTMINPHDHAELYQQRQEDIALTRRQFDELAHTKMDERANNIKTFVYDK